MRGRKNQEKPSSTNILPPCKVCGEPGTGFHYGVTTCGACKGFFRRSLTRDEPYECIQSPLCHVGPSTGRRKSCLKCRYDKCIAVGMCVEACKVGRYSTVKKSNDKKEAMEGQRCSFSSPPSCPHMEFTSNWLQPHCHALPNYGTSQDLDTFVDCLLEDCSSQNTDNNGFIHNPSSMEDAKGLNSEYKSPFNFDGNCTLYRSVRPDRTNNDVPKASSQECDAISQTDLTVSEHSNNSGLIRCFNFDIIDDNTLCLDERTNFNDKLCNSNTLKQNDFQHPSSFSILNNSTPSKKNTSRNVKHNTTPNSPTQFANNNYGENNISCKNSPNTTTISSWANMFYDDNIFDPLGSQYALSNSTVQDMSQSPQYTNLSPPHLSTPPHSDAGHYIDSDPVNRVSSSPLLSSFCSTQTEDISKTFVKPTYDKIKYDQFSNTINTLGYCRCQRGPKNQTRIGSSSHFMTVDTPCSVIPEFEVNNAIDSSKPKRVLEKVDEESQPAVKRQRVLQTMAADSSRYSSPENTNCLVPVLKDSEEKKDHSIILNIVTPDPMKYVLSMFDQFPYNSFEKDAIAPLLKLCYTSNSWIDEYMPQPVTQRIQTETVMGPPCFQMSSILSSAHSPELPAYVEDTRYDDTEITRSLFDYFQIVHSRYYGLESSFLSSNEKQKYLHMFYMICEVHDSLKGKLNLVDDDTYFTILETTGLDVDRRKEYFNSVIRDFDVSFTRDAKYYRALPGFKDLSLKDRINLTKSTFLLNKMLSSTRVIDADKDVFIDEERNRAVRMSTYSRVAGISNIVYGGFSQLYQQCRSLQLTFKERVILKVVVIMCPEFCDDLEQPHLVSEWNTAYLTCLRNHMKTCYGPDAANGRFDKILRLLRTAKSLRDALAETHNTMGRTFQKLVGGQNPSLLKELFCN